MTNRTDVQTEQLTAEQLEKELKRLRGHDRLRNRLQGACCLLTALFAVVLLAVMWLPVIGIAGEDMAPTLEKGDVVAALRTGSVQAGDLVVFQAGAGKLLVKRMIAGPGDRVDFLPDGTVTVNGQAIDEPYAAEDVGGECDIVLPCVVPEGRIFVLGDNRALSLDSRSSKIGCVAQEQIIGRAALKIWPVQRIKVLLSERQGMERK